VHESRDRSCVLEAQDFYDNDTKLTFTCYEPKGLASTMGIDLVSGKITNFSQAPGTLQRVEGIFPDGKYTCVESDRQCETLGGQRGASNIDIWKLMTRRNRQGFCPFDALQRLRIREGLQPVVSTDGRFMAVSVCPHDGTLRRRLRHPLILVSGDSDLAAVAASIQVPLLIM